MEFNRSKSVGEISMKKKKMKKITKNNDLQLNIKSQTIWPTVYNQILIASTNPGEINFWLDSLNFVQLRKNSKTKFQVIFLAPNVFYANYIIGKFTHILEEEFSKVLKYSCKVKIVNAIEVTEKLSGNIKQTSTVSKADWKRFQKLKEQFLNLQKKLRDFEERKGWSVR